MYCDVDKTNEFSQNFVDERAEEVRLWDNLKEPEIEYNEEITEEYKLMYCQSHNI